MSEKRPLAAAEESARATVLDSLRDDEPILPGVRRTALDWIEWLQAEARDTTWENACKAAREERDAANEANASLKTRNADLEAALKAEHELRDATVQDAARIGAEKAEAALAELRAENAILVRTHADCEKDDGPRCACHYALEKLPPEAKKVLEILKAAEAMEAWANRRGVAPTLAADASMDRLREMAEHLQAIYDAVRALTS